MQHQKKYIFLFAFLAIVANLSSCRLSSISEHIESTKPVLSPTINSEKLPVATKIPIAGDSSFVEIPNDHKGSSNHGTVMEKTIKVTLFTSDPQCQKLIPKKISVPSDQPVTSAVGKILEQLDSADFNLSGYRITVKNGVAKIDLRISPNSGRQFTSLSHCEQFALFGSLRKTLLSHSQWNIKEVYFTERGNKIVL